MLVNAAYYNPMRRPDLVEQRRDVVLSQMAKNNFITTPERDSLQALPMEIKFTPQGHDDGIATYFRVYLARIYEGLDPEKS
jgi:penicillin-binding protein 1A